MSGGRFPARRRQAPGPWCGPFAFQTTLGTLSLVEDFPSQADSGFTELIMVACRNMGGESIRREGLRDRFWERVPLDEMSSEEWEALCDGCGKCCLNKLEDSETNEIAFTRLACRLLDGETCRCVHYEFRRQIVPGCVVLTPSNIGEIAYWMPKTCAYRLLWDGKELPDWHPLVSGNEESVHEAGVSVLGWTMPEFEVPEEDWEDYVIEEPI